MSRNALVPIDIAPIPRIALRRPEAAEALGISCGKLDQLVKEAEIPHFRNGGTLLFPVAGLREWVWRQSQQQLKS